MDYGPSVLFDLLRRCCCLLFLDLLCSLLCFLFRLRELKRERDEDDDEDTDEDELG